jgi:hypothetical protein
LLGRRPRRRILPPVDRDQRLDDDTASGRRIRHPHAFVDLRLDI